MKPQIYPILHHQIAVYQSGVSGPVMVLCHGNSTSSRIFQKQFEGVLAERFHLVAFDYPGHGRSGNAGDPKDYSLPGLADVLLEVVRQLKLDNAFFVGFSLGGHVVLEASDRLPEAKGFMIYGTPPVGKPPAMDKAFLPHPSMGILFKGTLTAEEAELLEGGSFSPGTPRRRSLWKIACARTRFGAAHLARASARDAFAMSWMSCNPFANRSPFCTGNTSNW